MDNSDLQHGEIDLMIVSCLTGNITDEELLKLGTWISADTENMRHFNELKNSWVLSGGMAQKGSAVHIEESWKTLRNKIATDRQENAPDLRGAGTNRNSFASYLKVAASWLLIFGLGSLAALWLTGRRTETSASGAARIVQVSTPLGARSIIKLPDSTVIWLNAGTTITYAQDYGRHNRSVSLTGEAYFKVAKDSTHPFIVNTQDIVIRALGTRFNVKAYPEEKTISATLEEGKIDVRVVGLNPKSESILLQVKDKLIYHKETKETEKYVESPEDKVSHEARSPVKPRTINLLSNVRTELYTSWKDPRWIIYREPLSTLAPMLERRFNLKIIFYDESLKNYKFTGIIENETVDQLLKALQLTAPIDYQINKDTVRLTSDIRHKDDFKRIMTHDN